jgi:hypothetical protein
MTRPSKNWLTIASTARRPRITISANTPLAQNRANLPMPRASNVARPRQLERLVIAENSRFPSPARQSTSVIASVLKSKTTDDIVATAVEVMIGMLSGTAALGGTDPPLHPSDGPKSAPPPSRQAECGLASGPQTTFGKSGHRAWHWSLTLAARLRRQSAVNLSSHWRVVPLPPCWSMSRCKG